MWKYLSSTGIGVRVTASALVLLLAVLAVNNFVFVRGYQRSAQDAIVERAKAFTGLADETKNHVSTLQHEGAFDTEGMLAELKKDLAAGKSYKDTKIFGTIPVVAGWTAAGAAAKREGIDFTIKSFDARNKANEPKAGSFEYDLFAALTAQVESGGDVNIHRVDTATNTLHYMRAIKLDSSCLMCHGDPATSPTKDGKDVVGFKMENWAVGKMHGAYHVAVPLKPVDNQVASFVGGSLMWCVPLFIAATVFLTWLVARLVTRPIGGLTNSLKDIAQGEGDLSRRVDENRKDEIGQLAHWFNTFVHKIEGVVSEVKAGTTQIDAGALQIATASQSLAEGASQQAASLQQISASIEEMSSMTQQNAENAKQAATLAEASKHSADKGQSEMKQMSAAMGEIKQSSAEIGKIIKVIDEIAFQTNLLALNAAVEAARAGEAGKGFAVVAEEVRSLAQRSAEAAKTTSTMIEQSTKRADNGVELAGRVGTSLDEIADTTRKVNTLLAEIASASSEQAKGIGQVNTGVSELDKVTQQNAGNSEELASGAEETASQVASLQDVVKQFKTSADAGLTTHNGASATPTHSRPATKPVATKKKTTAPSTSKRATAAATAAKAAEEAIPMTDADHALESF